MSKNTQTIDTNTGVAMPRHPFFDTCAPHNALDCLDAINRAASVIELFDYVTMTSEREGLSSRATDGFVWLSESVRATLIYCSKRLTTLGGERRDEAQEKARYVSALLDSLSTLKNGERDIVLNAMAAQLEITRSDVDAFIGDTSTGEAV